MSSRDFQSLDVRRGQLAGLFVLGLLVSGITQRAAYPDEPVVLKGHSDLVWSVAYSADGKLLASASNDKTAILWDAATARELSVLRGHTDGLRSVAFSPDSKFVATASADKLVKIWDVATSMSVAQLGPHGDGVRAVAYSPDGKTLAAASGNGTITLWDPTNGQMQQELKGHTGDIFHVAFSPDGKSLASTSQDRLVKVWNLQTGQEAFDFKPESYAVIGVAYSPNGRILVTSGGAGEGGTISIWDPANGEHLGSRDVHERAIFSVAFSPDSKLIATAGHADMTAKLIDADSGSDIATLKGHNLAVMCVAFSSDGKTVATGSADNTVRLWNVNSAINPNAAPKQEELIINTEPMSDPLANFPQLTDRLPSADSITQPANVPLSGFPQFGNSTLLPDTLGPPLGPATTDFPSLTDPIPSFPSTTFPPLTDPNTTIPSLTDPLPSPANDPLSGFPQFGNSTLLPDSITPPLGEPITGFPQSFTNPFDTQISQVQPFGQPAQAAATKIDSKAAGDEMLRWIKSNNSFGSDSKLVSDMSELIQSEVAEGKPFSITMGPKLVKSGQPYQLHVFAGTFFKFRLTAEQARRLDLGDSSLTYSSGPASREMKGETLVKLGVPQFKNGTTIKGSEHITGSVDCETLAKNGEEIALRLSYYTTGNRMSFHYPESLPVNNGQVAFDFGEINSADGQEKFSGPVVVFMDLCTVKENNGNITVTLHSDTVAVLVDVE